MNYRWHSEWEACSKTCGNGSQSKSIVCRAKVDDTQYKKDESGALCNSTLKPVAEFRRCNDIKCPAQWTTTWSEVSKFSKLLPRLAYTICCTLTCCSAGLVSEQPEEAQAPNQLGDCIYFIIITLYDQN